MSKKDKQRIKPGEAQIQIINGKARIWTHADQLRWDQEKLDKRLKKKRAKEKRKHEKKRKREERKRRKENKQ